MSDPSVNFERRRHAEVIDSHAARILGKRYLIAWDGVDIGSLRELRRLVDDLAREAEKNRLGQRFSPF